MEQTNHHKRIILDFDDTLAFTTNREWSQAKPNPELIEKTNSLYDQGWTIDIFTARGSISCETREEAAAKYRSGMEEWLAHNNVKYHSVSFDKPLGAYYIDDKGMHPDQFIGIDIRELPGGLSGSDIYTDGELVHKTDERAHIVANWYNHVKGTIRVPYVDRVVGETLSMSYEYHQENWFNKNHFHGIGLIQDALEKMKNVPVIEHLHAGVYKDRIRKHAEDSKEQNLMVVANKLRDIELVQSFSHGDFGITNMLFDGSEMILIDPIPDVFGCTKIDAAKFIASLYINDYDDDIIERCTKSMIVFNDIDEEDFRVLIASEMTRIYKYHSDKKLIITCVNKVI